MNLIIRDPTTGESEIVLTQGTYTLSEMGECRSALIQAYLFAGFEVVRNTLANVDLKLPPMRRATSQQRTIEVLWENS